MLTHLDVTPLAVGLLVLGLGSLLSLPKELLWVGGDPLDVVLLIPDNEIDPFEDIGDIVDPPLLDLQLAHGLIEVEFIVLGFNKQLNKFLGELNQPILLSRLLLAIAGVVLDTEAVVNEFGGGVRSLGVGGMLLCGLSPALITSLKQRLLLISQDPARALQVPNLVVLDFVQGTPSPLVLVRSLELFGDHLVP